MSQIDIAPVNAQMPNINAHEFFSRVPDGVWNLFSSWTDLDDYESLHHVIHKNKQCEAHWLNNLRKYAHRADPLFDVFTSVKSLRFVFVRKIDVPRGWELHLVLKDHYGKDKHESLSHSESFAKACQDGDLDIVRAMVERTQVDLEARDENGWTPLHKAAFSGHLPVVQYLCEQGADKEARMLTMHEDDEDDWADEYSENDYGWTPLHQAAENGHLSVVQYLCEQGADMEAMDLNGDTPLHWAAYNGHLSMMQYLCEQGADKEASDRQDRTPLHLAAQQRHTAVMQFLSGGL